jgi:hypothetical protein
MLAEPVSKSLDHSLKPIVNAPSQDHFRRRGECRQDIAYEADVERGVQFMHLDRTISQGRSLFTFSDTAGQEFFKNAQIAILCDSIASESSFEAVESSRHSSVMSLRTRSSS